MRARAYASDDDTTFSSTPQLGGQLFTAEEMQAIREQYEEAVEAERARNEELEFQLRMALATVRDAELNARRGADEMQKVHVMLQALLLGREHVEAPRPVPAPRASTQARPTAKIGGPPPIPPKAAVTSGANRRGPLPPRDLSPFKRAG
jgi:hypothetical protein